MLQNARVTAFTVSELLSANQQGAAVILAYPPYTQVNLKNLSQNYFFLFVLV